MPTLAELVNAIPVASQGDIITPESHNSLRTALAAVATQLGAATSTQTVAPTFTPVFLTTGTPNIPSWNLGPGFSRNPPNGNSASGWLPVQLPQGARIQRILVQAGRSAAIAAPAQADVALHRQSLRGGNTASTILAQASLLGPNASDPFEVSAMFGPAGLTGALLTEAQLVNNDDYKYFFRAEMLLQTAGPNVFIYGVRVECRIG